MPSRVKPLAVGAKIFATIEALGVAWFFIGSCYLDMTAATPPRDAPPDWGTPGYYHRMCLHIIVVAFAALLVAIPNRWIVSSKIFFGLVLLIAVSPLLLCVLLVVSAPASGSDFMTAYFICLMLLAIGLWPLSICLSFWRHRKGETFLYA